MQNEAKEGIHRRETMIGPLVALGTSTVLMPSSQTASRHGAAPAAVPSPKGTIYTGDIVHGKKVVSTLGIQDLAPGQVHKLYFQGVQMPNG